MELILRVPAGVEPVQRGLRHLPLNHVCNALGNITYKVHIPGMRPILKLKGRIKKVSEGDESLEKEKGNRGINVM